MIDAYWDIIEGLLFFGVAYLILGGLAQLAHYLWFDTKD